MDWIVHRVTKSWTQLSDLQLTSLVYYLIFNNFLFLNSLRLTEKLQKKYLTQLPLMWPRCDYQN